MPEGDTVHKLANAIHPMLQGATLRLVQARMIDTTKLIGCAIEAVVARGKHLFIQLDNGLTIRTHLGMYGSWHRYAPNQAWQKPSWQASLMLGTDRDVFVCFNAKEIELLRSAGIRHRTLEAHLGPDLLSDKIDLDQIMMRAFAHTRPETLIVDILLDQRIAGGIGNVYKSELLFLQRVHPETTFDHITITQLMKLYSKAHELLQQNLGGGRRTTRFNNDGRGRLWVYKRRSKPCLLCDTPILSKPMGRDLRSTYWCPRCQT